MFPHKKLHTQVSEKEIQLIHETETSYRSHGIIIIHTDCVGVKSSARNGY